MEIDISEFFAECDAFEFSASRAERGINAGKETWANAMGEADRKPLLTSKSELDALRDHCKGFGAWEDSEIDAWTPQHCNAMFVQLISGDIREAGLDQEPDDLDWERYERAQARGELSGNILRGDDGRIFFYLGT